MSACSTEDFVESFADDLTSDAANISVTETIAPSSTTVPATDTNAVAMVSYSADLSDARPLSGAALKQTMVYMFFSNSSQYSSIRFYCCRGINGTSIGEPHNASVSDSSTLPVYAIDLSQYSTAGTRELYVDAIRSDGNGYDSISTYFSIRIATIAVNPEPEDNTEPVSEPTPITEPEPEPSYIAEPVVTEPEPVAITEPEPEPVAITEPEPEPTPAEPVVINYSDVNLSWTAPFEREDNTPISLSDIAGYKIYYGTSRDKYNNSVNVDDGTAEGYTFKNFSSGTYYFVVTTYDTDGRESQYSTVVEINI
jgi:hypothetical protein